MPIDHSQGHAFVRDGRIVYSPNCKRIVEIPVKPIAGNGYLLSQFKDLAAYQEPWFLTESHGYLAFIPLSFSFSGLLFGRLHYTNIASLIEQDPWSGMFRLTASIKAQWLDLELFLLNVISSLRKHVYFPFPYFHPPTPSMFGYAREFFWRHVLRQRIECSRDWFLMLLACASFIIVQLENPETALNPDLVPEWIHKLAALGFTQSWLSDLRSVVVNSFFGRNTDHVGTFLDLFDTRNTATWYKAPPAEYLCQRNVPIWYLWGPAEADAAKSTSSKTLRNFIPPPHALQNATTQLVRSPSPPLSGPPSSEAHAEMPRLETSRTPDVRGESETAEAPDAHGESQPEDARATEAREETRRRKAARAAHLATKPWSKHFEAMATAHQAHEAKENATERQRRLNRTRQPPMRTTVYLWDWSLDNPCVLVRSRLPNRECEDYLTNPHYRRQYDPYFNFWEVSLYFDFGEGYTGADDESSDEEEEEYYSFPWPPREGDDAPMVSKIGGGLPAERSTDADLPDFTREAVDDFVEQQLAQPRSPAVIPSWPCVSEVNLLVDAPYDAHRFVTKMYGYVSPLPLSAASAVDDKVWDQAIKSVGLLSEAGSHQQPLPLGSSMVSFLQLLSSKDIMTQPSPDSWDFDTTCRDPVNVQRLKDLFPRVGPYFIMRRESFISDPSFDFTIALTTASDAVRAYRLFSLGVDSPYILAGKLLELGIPFRTFQPVNRAPTAGLSSAKSVLPVRVANYVFTSQDYRYYVEQRSDVLASPRGRAALLLGGIIGRLALEHLGMQTACLGPSSAVTQHQVGVSFRTPDGTVYMDDELTSQEIHMICGEYICNTGYGEQIVRKSWWPLPERWDDTKANGVNWGHWTQVNEHWFLRRMELISEGKAQPLRTSEWRNILRGSPFFRAVTKRHGDQAMWLYEP